MLRKERLGLFEVMGRVGRKRRCHIYCGETLKRPSSPTSFGHPSPTPDMLDVGVSVRRGQNSERERERRKGPEREKEGGDRRGKREREEKT
jgi:hypothetical protein